MHGSKGAGLIGKLEMVWHQTVCWVLGKKKEQHWKDRVTVLFKIHKLEVGISLNQLVPGQGILVSLYWSANRMRTSIMSSSRFILQCMEVTSYLPVSDEQAPAPLSPPLSNNIFPPAFLIPTPPPHPLPPSLFSLSLPLTPLSSGNVRIAIPPFHPSSFFMHTPPCNHLSEILNCGSFGK